MRNARVNPHEAVAIRLHVGADDRHRDVGQPKRRLESELLDRIQQLTAEALPNRHAAFTLLL